MALYRDKYRIETTRYRARDYRSRGWYFVTVCSHQKEHIFGEVIGGEVRLSRSARLRKRSKKIWAVITSMWRSIRKSPCPTMSTQSSWLRATTHFRLTPKGYQVWLEFRRPADLCLQSFRSYKTGVTRRCHELGVETNHLAATFLRQDFTGDANITAVREYIWNNPGNWSDDSENQNRTL